jgi:hypothetical protein
MKGLLKPLENFKGTLLEETEFVSALYAEIEKVSVFSLQKSLIKLLSIVSSP